MRFRCLVYSTLQFADKVRHSEIVNDAGIMRQRIILLANPGRRYSFRGVPRCALTSSMIPASFTQSAAHLPIRFAYRSLSTSITLTLSQPLLLACIEEALENDCCVAASCRVKGCVVIRRCRSTCDGSSGERAGCRCPADAKIDAYGFFM